MIKLACFFLICIALTSCITSDEPAQPKALIGKWQLVDSPNSGTEFSQGRVWGLNASLCDHKLIREELQYGTLYRFHSANTFTYETPYPWKRTINGTWSIQGNDLEIQYNFPDGDTVRSNIDQYTRYQDDYVEFEGCSEHISIETIEAPAYPSFNSDSIESKFTTPASIFEHSVTVNNDQVNISGRFIFDGSRYIHLIFNFSQFKGVGEYSVHDKNFTLMWGEDGESVTPHSTDEPGYNESTLIANVQKFDPTNRRIEFTIEGRLGRQTWKNGVVAFNIDEIYP